MKKAIIILAIITTGIALLFAQTPSEVPTKEAPVAQAVASGVMDNVEIDSLSQPVASKSVDDEAEAEVVVETSSLTVPENGTPDGEEGLGADEIAMAEELGEDALIEEGRISLRLKDAELKDVVRMFSALSDANIIVPALDEAEIEKKIDVNLDNVEWQPALEAILDTHELELYEKIPGTQVYAIRKKLPGAPEATEMKIFKLDYASVNSVTNILSRMVGATGSYSIFPERNVVVAQATAKALQSIGDVMEQIDLPRQQVFIESKFLELSDKAQRDLGINWQVLQAYGVGVQGISGSYNYDDSKVDTIRKSQASNVDNSFGENRFTDIAGRPYESLTGEPTGGQIEWPARPGNDPGDVRILNMMPTTFSENLSAFTSEDSVSSLDVSTVTRALGATLSASDFELILSALEQKDGVDIVSNPKIIVANEEEAFIHIGDKEPNILVEQTRGTADNPGAQLSVRLDSAVPYFEDGVKVIVKPTINTASNIMVRITPEITRFTSRKEVKTSTGVVLIDFPVSRTKKIDTIFSLESGQTAAIGGLTQVLDSTKESKIPWLGSIPFLGRFFSYEQEIKEQNETIIFVTVGLANPSSIDVDTGLPDNTRLAQRYQIREGADLRIDRAERNLLRTKENAEMKKELQRLRATNQKLLEKQKKNAPVDEKIQSLELAPVADLSSISSADSSAVALAEGEAPAIGEESGGGVYEVDSTETE